MIERRAFIRATVAGIAAAVVVRPGHTQEVSNSIGTNHPKLKAPVHACDCHVHIYDPARFPFYPSPRPAPSNATASQYMLYQKRIGTSRAVIVTPRNYAIDNRATLDAIAQLGPQDARGIAVLHPTVTDAELKDFHKGGIRGIRFSLTDSTDPVVTKDMIEPLAKRVAGLGWHVQFNINGGQIVELADLINRLPTQVVFDHMGLPPLPAGIEHPSHAIVLGMLDKRHAWVKISDAYTVSRIGPPSYPDATAIARSFVKVAPQRLLWGSDWPHPSLPDERKPDDALLFDLFSEWVPDEAMRNRILVRNPETVYGFAKST